MAHLLTDSAMKPDTDQLAALAHDPFSLTGLLEYQEGAIVSRTLVDRDAVTLTVFALDAGQTISEHTAPHQALVQVLDGTATISIEDETHEVLSGEGLVFPAETPHAVAAEERFKMLLTMVR